MSPDLRSRVVDGGERFVLVGLLSLLAYRLVPHLSQKPLNLVYLASETILVAMIACRQPATQISLKPWDWLNAFAGTFLPLMVSRSEGDGFVYGGILLPIGFAIGVGAQLSLRRSFGVVAANRGVKTDGLYCIVRHPMYLGYFLTHFGFLLTNPTLWNAGIYGLWVAFQLRRINAEEGLLSTDVVYAAFKNRVRYRLVPYLY